MNAIVQMIADAVVAGMKLAATKINPDPNAWPTVVANWTAQHEADVVALVEYLLAKVGSTPGPMMAGPPPSKDDIKVALKASVAKV